MLSRICIFHFINSVFILAVLVNVSLCEDSKTQELQEKLKLSVISQQLNPAELLEIINQDWKKDFDAETKQQENLLMKAILKHIIQAADFIVSHPKANEEIALEAVRNKMQALGVLARSGDTTASNQAVAMAEKLQHDKRPLVAREGKLIVLSNRLREIPKMDQQQRDAFIEDLVTLFSITEMTTREIQIAQLTARIFEQASSLDSAQNIMQKTAKLLDQSSKTKLKETAKQFNGAARRYGLPGHPMKLSGKTLAGKPFDIKNLKGKVVLVQFWASWCTYCLQEMPHIIKLYNTYHEDGFEVIGVNLDDSADRAKKIIDDAQLPWPQLFSSEIETLGLKNPNATYYGIASIPQCILIDRKGNVVTLQARGKILNQELERLFIQSKKK